MELNNEWELFMENPEMELVTDTSPKHTTENTNSTLSQKVDIQCSPLYISTKTKIAHFPMNGLLNIKDIFWKLPVTSYHEPKEGIIKKQIKITTLHETELNRIKEQLKEIDVKQVHVISDTIYNASKDKKHVQKISVGISKKDITCFRMKQKSVFYNCVALVVRVFDNDDNTFKEVHVKVFNTGKMEIPGIQNDRLLIYTIKIVFQTITDILGTYIGYNPQTIETDLNIEIVLINANFNCGFYMKREKMYNLLRNDYNIISLYDPCSYPGIQSKFYYNTNKKIQNGKCECMEKCGKKYGPCMEISFMIFRTGSALIVGHCTENVIFCIYEFLKNIFKKHYALLHDGYIGTTIKEKKIRKLKRTVLLTS